MGEIILIIPQDSLRRLQDPLCDPWPQGSSGRYEEGQKAGHGRKEEHCGNSRCDGQGQPDWRQVPGTILFLIFVFMMTRRTSSKSVVSQYGHTKIFFRAGILGLMEEIRDVSKYIFFWKKQLG